MRFFICLFIVSTFSLTTVAQRFIPQVIYNSDSRKEISEESPQETMMYIQKRTLAMVSNAKLFPQQSGDILFLPRHYGRAFKLCKDERFYEQPSLPNCTASVIGKDLVLTAGHCISENTCHAMRFISDYVMDGPTNPIRTYPEKIFNCKKVLYDNDTFGSDIAIVQIDREFPLSALSLTEQSLTLQDEILAVGFPSGLPMKSSGPGPIRSITDNIIIAELETYGGNSGSPVFNKNSNKIAGLLVGGEDDFILADNKKCFKSKVCDSQTCQGEEIIPAKTIQYILYGLVR